MTWQALEAFEDVQIVSIYSTVEQVGDGLENPPRLALSRQRTSGREGEVLISVDDGREHYYTLNFDTGSLDGVLYTKPTRGEPRNRPSVRGRLVLGTVIGTIQTLASKKIHPVFDSISVVATDRDGLEPLRGRSNWLKQANDTTVRNTSKPSSFNNVSRKESLTKFSCNKT